jgi:hypothetical protein
VRWLRLGASDRERFIFDLETVRWEAETETETETSEPLASHNRVLLSGGIAICRRSGGGTGRTRVVAGETFVKAHLRNFASDSIATTIADSTVQLRSVR